MRSRQRGTSMNHQKRCGGCGTERDKGQRCPTCGLVNDPIPMTPKQAWVIRRKWDASEGPIFSFRAELNRDLALLFPRS